MEQYLELVDDVLKNGHSRSDRTGVGTISLFGRQLRFDLTKGFPLCTTKKVNFQSVIRELLWILSGSTNVTDLHPCKIWDAWANENGELGPVYGAQWRNFGGRKICHDEIGAYTHLEQSQYGGIDQIANVINSLKNEPFSRRHIVNAWSANELEYMALPPCHAMFQFFVHEMNDYNLSQPAPMAVLHELSSNVEGVYSHKKRYLSCQLYQRSADLALGVPFNIASYAALTHMIAQQVDMVPFEFIHAFGDVHVYSNHETGLREQLKRSPDKLPTFNLNYRENIDDYVLNDFALMNYVHAPAIDFCIAV